MKIIEIQNFDLVKDPVKTEETIYRQLLYNKEKIQTEYVYVAFPIADSINKKGVKETQKIIDTVSEKYANESLFFVCQHIHVDRLDFHHNLVFTPHATIVDDYIAIPHFSCNYDISLSKEWKKRSLDFSFMGSFVTHKTRKYLLDNVKKNEKTIIIDTNNDWHFNIEPEQRKKHEHKYIEMLGDTKFSFCPRGTGPSTIRVWESIAMGAKPIILSDLLKMPKRSEELFIKIPEKFCDEDIENIIESNNEWDNSKYFHLFSNEHLYETIVEYIK